MSINFDKSEEPQTTLDKMNALAKIVGGGVETLDMTEFQLGTTGWINIVRIKVSDATYLNIMNAALSFKNVSSTGVVTTFPVEVKPDQKKVSISQGLPDNDDASLGNVDVGLGLDYTGKLTLKYKAKSPSYHTFGGIWTTTIKTD